METIAFLGCSRGLGRSTCLAFDHYGSLKKALLVARNETQLESLASELTSASETFHCDFSKKDQLPQLLEKLKELKINRIFYFAGGGPYGDFQHKQWKDHFWGLQVTLLTPAEILHALLNSELFPSLKQVVFIGSQIADSLPDPKAASYATAKHGLRGLIQSVLLENPKLDIRLYRPGYMNTDLLPKNARPREQGIELLQPEEAAQQLLHWTVELKGPALFP